MVKIINGEIYQDNDPRLKAIAQQRATAASSSSTSAGRVRNIFSEASQSDAQPELTPPQQISPINRLEKALSIEKIQVPIPAVSFLGVSASRVPLVYFLLVGVLYLVFGYKAIIFSAGLYIMYKHGEK